MAASVSSYSLGTGADHGEGYAMPRTGSLREAFEGFIADKRYYGVSPAIVSFFTYAGTIRCRGQRWGARSPDGAPARG
jgi:hypothetical protein